MSFSFIKLLSTEGCLSALVQHQDQKLTCRLNCTADEAAELPDIFTAEVDFEQVVQFETDFPPNDACSGFFSTEDPSVIVADGTVHNLVGLDSEEWLADVYVMNGPEFFAVTSKDLNGVTPKLGTRLRVWVKGFEVYPTNT